MKTWLALLFLTIVATLPLAGLAEEGGFGLSDLNPFPGKSGPPVSGSVSDAPTSGWKLPKLPNPFAGMKPASSKPAGPSGWQKMTTGTKAFFTKTADVLNPFDDAKDNEEIAPSGSKSPFSRTSARKKKEEESKGFFSLPSWSWGAEEEPKKPKTVQDFLAQPRPEF